MSGAAPAERKLQPYEELVAQWRALRGYRDLRVREVACVGAPRTLLSVEMGAAGKPLVTISAGVHGDEPAAPWALLSIVRDGLLDARFAYRLWPCTNPSGYAAFTRQNLDGFDVNRSFGRGGTTPEARAIITANRDRKFALSIDLHEDYEAHGFYLYENLSGGAPKFVAPVLRSIVDAGFGLQQFPDDYDDAYPAGARDARATSPGCILTYSPQSYEHFKDALPYSLYLLRSRATAHALTFETPRTRPWRDRIAMHRVAVVSALATLQTALSST